MAIATAKLSELPLRNSLPFPLTTHFLFSSTFKPPFQSLRKSFYSSASLRTDENPKPKNLFPPKSPWLSNWGPHKTPPPPAPAPAPAPAPRKVTQSDGQDKTRYLTKDKGRNAIERIVLRLRNLGLTSDDEDDEEAAAAEEIEFNGGDLAPVTGEERLADLLQREWVRPDTIFSNKDDEEDDDLVLPWERKESERKGREEGEGGRERKRTVKAPTLAELTIEDEELRRLRRMGCFDGQQRRTGGLVIWRAGSVMVVYRGSNYEGPPSKSQPVDREGDALFVPDVSSADSAAMTSDNVAALTSEKREPAMRIINRTENMTEEDAEFNSLLDGLGPRFEEWWGTGILPVDADLLSPKVPGYKTPFRLLPTGMRSRLTNAEMTNLRKLAKTLPCHFALGIAHLRRNRNHQGLAAAILQLWEKSLVAKIAVKRGIQNTNNKLMADELKKQVLHCHIPWKGFLPTSVAAALAEREELTKQIQDAEEKVRIKGVEAPSSGDNEGKALAGTLAEFYEAQARWGKVISSEEREKMMEDASRAKRARIVKRIEHKLAVVSPSQKLRAEKLLAKIEASMVPSGPDYDQETITDEEKAMFRRVGLRMKAYLPLGIRGVFDGVIENMHLHWKHRELVKLISKQKTLAFVEDTARLLEYESAGILVAIERVPKGFALIYYRGKNYRRPINMRPRNLLTKAKALKRSVAMQRHEALSQHISELERTIEQMKKEIGLSLEEDHKNNWTSEEQGQLNHVSEFTQSEDEAAFIGSDEEGDHDDFDEEDDDDDDDIDWEANGDFEFSGLQSDDPLSKNG
ncbi:hypothetical protein GH714_026116 [Hevea brasiliensis]|uniref:CRM domain-containing protein n=1 Tax=Hevea brasiliensis TaxID=3981 RepID=A0A6A6LBB0_HEVBR|nr:hypothetical protein GH714_026116 [Hevea brasiliensis]